MQPLAVSLIAFAFVSGGTLFGMFLRSKLPGHHLSPDAKDVVRLGTGLIGTISALVLGLLIASAKSSFDTQSAQVRQLTANCILLDGLLAEYGPETNSARNLMRSAVVTMAERIWRQNSSDHAAITPFKTSRASDAFLEKLHELSPTNDTQRSIKDQAIQVSAELAKTRLLLFTQGGDSIPLPFLAVLIFWLAVIFASFSLFAQPNAIVLASLFIFALSAAGSIYLILELGQPFAGLMQISSEPLRNALAPLAR